MLDKKSYKNAIIHSKYCLVESLKKARKESNISLDEAAKLLNLPLSKLEEIEMGQRLDSLAFICRIAAIYDKRINIELY